MEMGESLLHKTLFDFVFLIKSGRKKCHFLHIHFLFRNRADQDIFKNWFL